MLVAVMDQSTGTSTSFCSKMTLPLMSLMAAVRRSHWNLVVGETPALENLRVKRKPEAEVALAGWKWKS